MLQTIVRKNQYQDSVALMVLSRTLSDLDGVAKVSVMMGTPANKQILADTGFSTPELDDAAPSDLVIGVDADDQETVDSVLAQASELLKNQAAAGGGATRTTVRSLARAQSKLPGANLALVSIPGEYAAAQAHHLLDAGLHVMLFSDNVTVADEASLKQRARDLGLLVMGPDCGTAAFAGTALAFGNLTSPGSIGVVGASGTGTQEVMVQIDRLGAGVSQAIGLGGRDLSEQIGGGTCLQALAALDADPATDTIVIVSKPPAPQVRARVEEAAQGLSKPVVAVILGERPDAARVGNITYAATLADAAHRAVELAGTAGFPRSDGGVVGMFTGGTLANEAAMILRDELGLPADNGEHPAGSMLHEGPHRVVDLGDDVYTQGRPHPMIDPTLRAELLPGVLADPTTAVLLLDVVTGYGSAADPAGAIIPAIAEGVGSARADGREVAVVASVTGTARDPQALDAQVQALRDAGVRVLPDNASAARHAAALARAAADRRPHPDAAPAPAAVTALLTDGPKVINLGLASFADDLIEQQAGVVHWNWTPPAGGDPRLARLVDLLMER